ncbi:MAG: patatin-like phospholipase family protein [Marinifilaceae bacterium]
MKSRILILLLSLLPLFTIAQSKDSLQTDRPKIGLVLSGGGAKGFAHIGVLKVLEEVGIPIDYISGTSMGSIIGGFYAIGYSADDIEKMVLAQNWEQLLSDYVSRQHIPFHEKEDIERYVLSFPIKPKGIQLPSGIIQGQNIVNLFADLSQPYHDETDFTKFPIPFVCVAADIETGEAVVLDKGYLPKAMRASMGIPTLLTPVENEGRLLVDGGMVNNFPVKEVLNLGADIVIGVDVQAGPKKKEELKSINDIINQTISLMAKPEFQQNKELCDVYIKPDIRGYSVSSFQNADSLIDRGEQMARNFVPLLKELKQKLDLRVEKRETLSIPDGKQEHIIGDIKISGLKEVSRSLVLGKLNFNIGDTIHHEDLQNGINRIYGSRYFDRVNYRLSGDKQKTIHLNVKERTTNRFNVGFHYDNDNKASVLLNTTFRNKLRSGSRLSLDLKLSENPRFTATYNIDNGLKPGYQIRLDMNDTDVFRYEDGKKVASYDFTYTKLDLNMHTIFRESFSIGFGGKLEYYNLETIVGVDGFEEKRDNFYINYYGFLKMDTHDKAHYPRRGLSLYGEYKLVTDNGWGVNDNERPISIAYLKMKKAISLSPRVTFYPSFYGRVVWGKEIPPEYYTYVGGMDQTSYFDIQVPFIGLRRMEQFTENAFVGRGDFQFELFRNNYLILRTNVGKYVDNVNDALTQGTWIKGVGLTYSYNSIIGPMEASVMISDAHKKLTSFVSLGFCF